MKKLIISFSILSLIFSAISFCIGYFVHVNLTKPSFNKDFEIQRLNNLVSDLKNNLVERDKKIEDIERNIQENKNTEYKHPIDIEEEKCIKNSSTFDYPNCSYYAGTQWEKEINKYLNLLKKEMNTTDYSLIEVNQKKWEQSSQSDIKMIEKYINSKQGLIYVTIGTSTITDIYKSRALLLRKIYDEYIENKEILDEYNNLN